MAYLIDVYRMGLGCTYIEGTEPIPVRVRNLVMYPSAAHGRIFSLKS